jgi:hypothetical protein
MISDTYVVFDGGFLAISGHSYEILPDGKRILVVKEMYKQGESRELKIITN